MNPADRCIGGKIASHLPNREMFSLEEGTYRKFACANGEGAPLQAIAAKRVSVL
jgi:hypothetical protein